MDFWTLGFLIYISLLLALFVGLVDKYTRCPDNCPCKKGK